MNQKQMIATVVCSTLIATALWLVRPQVGGFSPQIVGATFLIWCALEFHYRANR